ncbi:LysE family transporter [Sphaerisporangium sp. NPDC005288]|uniref:LysE family translocator n=1 Tax=Sphaerisporangium sp. NPDC005288 TaxID=3155114 RepID=UPI0033A38877
MSWLALLPLLGFWTLAVISPGPDFLITLRYSAGRSRGSGLRVAAGVVTGIAVWALAALFGLTVVVERFEWLYTATRVAGALFLVALGVLTIRAARRPAARAVETDLANQGDPGGRTGTATGEMAASAGEAFGDRSAGAADGVTPPVEAGATQSRWREWRVGLLTNLANPKALAFFGALFASLLPHGASMAVRAGTLATMLVIAFTWFGCVALLSATPVIARSYRRARRKLDIVTGALFIGMGSLLIPRG